MVYVYIYIYIFVYMNIYIYIIYIYIYICMCVSLVVSACLDICARTLSLCHVRQRCKTVSDVGGGVDGFDFGFHTRDGRAD